MNVLDLGAGINGLSYKFFQHKVKYIGVEAVGQLVNLMNSYFSQEKVSGIAIHESLFNLTKIKNLIFTTKGKKIIFLFKVF